MEDSTSPVVLIIDDEPVILRLLRVLLEDEGFTVFEAMTGPIGLGLIPAVFPQAVVLDVMMPDMDGIEVCARITADYPILPVVILTARDDPAIEDRCMAAGARHFFTKPLVSDRLADALRSLCGMEKLAMRPRPRPRPRVVVDRAGASTSPQPEAKSQANSLDKHLTRDEDGELRRLNWFSEVGALADHKQERVLELRLRDRRKAIRPPRDPVAQGEETRQSN